MTRQWNQATLFVLILIKNRYWDKQCLIILFVLYLIKIKTKTKNIFMSFLLFFYYQIQHVIIFNNKHEKKYSRHQQIETVSNAFTVSVLPSSKYVNIFNCKRQKITNRQKIKIQKFTLHIYNRIRWCTRGSIIFHKNMDRVGFEPIALYNRLVLNRGCLFYTAIPSSSMLQ